MRPLTSVFTFVPSQIGGTPEISLAVGPRPRKSQVGFVLVLIVGIVLVIIVVSLVIIIQHRLICHLIRFISPYG